MSVSCSEKSPSGVLQLQVGSGQDLGGSKEALAEDDGGVSVGDIAESVCIEAVSIGASVVESFVVESVGVEALGAAVEEVRVEAVVVKSFAVEDVVGMALSVLAIFLTITDLHLGQPTLHLRKLHVFYNNFLKRV